MSTRRKRILTTDRTFGIENPIKDSPYGNIFSMSRNSIDLYKSQLYTLMFTNKGERVMMPEFGTNIQALLFEPYDENIYERIRSEIQAEASRWIPGINIDKVLFEDKETNLENNRLILTIKFSLIVDPSIEDYIQIEKSV